MRPVRSSATGALRMILSTSLRLAAAAALALALASLPTQVRADPFPVRNQHPLVVLFGLPAPLPARLPAASTWQAGATTQWSNFAVTDASGDREFTLDGEVFEFRGALGRTIGDRFMVRTELAYRSLDEGSLDGFIERWHDTFGLPNGSRNRLPEDQLLLEYRVAGSTLWQIDAGTSGLADVPVSFGWQLLESPSAAIAAWFTVKAPVGDAGDLTGSGAADLAASLAADTRFGERWELFGQANLAWLGEGDLLPALQEDFAWSVLAGTSWNAWRGLDLTVQVEANSAVFDTGLDDLDGGATVLTFGGTYVTQGGWRWDASVSEDVDVDASPDVVLNFGVRRGF
jgi:hypothetical protein